MADLLLYWQDHPPTHITVAAIARGLSGGGSGHKSSHSSGRVGPGEASGPGSMEQLATMLGPPAERFRPPCRMLTPAANDPATTADTSTQQHHG